MADPHIACRKWRSPKSCKRAATFVSGRNYQKEKENMKVAPATIVLGGRPCRVSPANFSCLFTTS
jgi:hypothetical protein